MRSSNLCTPGLGQVVRQLSEEVQWKLELTYLQIVGGSLFKHLVQDCVYITLKFNLGPGAETNCDPFSFATYVDGAS
jgi:hypothetical protein